MNHLPLSTLAGNQDKNVSQEVDDVENVAIAVHPVIWIWIAVFMAVSHLPLTVNDDNINDQPLL